MIVEITAENVAILDRASLSLGTGLTVLTGETGAGKSLLVDAIELALGARGDSDLVRAGASRASVNMTVDLSARPDLANICAAFGIVLEDGLLYVQREVLAEGRSQARVQGKMAPLSTLKTLGKSLVDLHGQHDHQSLLHPEQHLGFLDAFVGAPAEVLADRVAAEYSTVSDLEKRLQAARSGRRGREQRIDLLRYQVQEIESVGPRAGEFEELENVQSRLKHAERLSAAAQDALEALSRREGSAQEEINRSVRRLEESSSLDPALQSSLDPLRGALYSLEEAIELLRNYAESIEADPKRLEQVAERLDSLRKLRKKYGDSEAEILEHSAQAARELSLIEESAEGEDELAAHVGAAKVRLEETCSQLTALRAGGARKLSEAVQSQLLELAMEKAKFETRIAPKAPEPDGADAVEFFFSANVGEPPRPLAKIASGGEIARLMLALKTVLAGKAGVPTLIFDEVESGLGGPTAAVVGKKLEDLARHYQVIVISHLPQIAGRAASHFRIEKSESAGRVTTKVRSLAPDERVEEIARMLSGEKVGETAKAHALELLEQR